MSPVEQEARKAAIKDLAKGSPALESRRLHDHLPWSTAGQLMKSKSQSGRRAGEDPPTSTRKAQPIDIK